MNKLTALKSPYLRYRDRILSTHTTHSILTATMPIYRLERNIDMNAGEV